MHPPEPALTVEVYFDFVCPWCLIGKRQLDAAATRLAALRPDVPLQLVWHSYPLLPDTPAAGLPYQAFYVARLGSPEAVARRRAQVLQAGQAAGVDFAFDRIAVLPNTAAAHARVAQAAAAGTEAQQRQLIDRIFMAYFNGGQDIGDASVLAQLARECGLPAEAPPAGGERSHARHPQAKVRHLVSGVPFFVFDGSLALAGAVSADALLDAMLRALRD
ncbi:DsbA family oxidoreductase [Variovorax sp. J22P271]|uniref:DsbA family oxidoreductase n=1 Tax=Variovorax davisae TaxID=3053515 RepID=UPI002578B965|nr:DsbA family oxidoreductase [Variovorax sp. J22P271]MDM0033750.1 DsbA family oxidoreductase [Variovorax sp. J22P271]